MLKTFDFLPSLLNNSNDTSPSGFANLRTYQQTNAGGLVLGDCFDCDALFAAQQSYTPNGQLFEGRYRRIQVDANATAANVARGKAAYVVPGYSVLSALILTAGSGQTAGTYQVTGTGGGGTGAILQIVVGTAGTVTTVPTVVQAGSGFTSAPTFTLAAGGTAATFQSQMTLNTYIVTSYDVTGVNLSQGRGIFLNSPTPGNYSWIQENGIGTFDVGTVTGSAAVGMVLTPTASGAGLFTASVATAAPLAGAFGTALDQPIANTYIRGVMTLPVWNG